jgi:hypothetical protein
LIFSGIAVVFLKKCGWNKNTKNYGRECRYNSVASPSLAIVLTKSNTEVNIIEILSSNKVPALIMQRTNDIEIKIKK